jgi:hypothetical protein
MNGLDWRQKMKFAVKAMGMIKDVQTVGAESIYTADEAAHRLRHCKTIKNQGQKELCETMGAKFITTGPINYMTFKGKRAFYNMCSTQRTVDSCRKNCDLTMKFFSAPTESDCSKLQDDWQSECAKFARGDISFNMPTAEDEQLIKDNRRAVR